jgi:hypothetical protein
MPRRLDNIAAVLLYICGSPMLASFGGLSLLDAKTRNRQILNMGVWVGGGRGWAGEDGG